MINVKKLLIIIPAAILGIAVLFVLFLFLNGRCFRRHQHAEDSASFWMSDIPDGTLLKEIAIPGSHDAGTCGMLWPGETQSYSIKDQLTFGARYFDIRVNKTEEGYRIYHSVLNGVDFLGVLSDIKDFIMSHPTEVLILDFQHFSGDSKNDVYAFLSDELEKDGLVVHNDKDLSDVEFISTLTLGEARGKCVVLFGGDEYYSDWVFPRNNDSCSKEFMTLDSYYLEDCHKSGFESLVNEAHPVYFNLLTEKQAKDEDCLFVLQCQLTDGKMIFGPWSVERGQEKKMDEYIKSLKDSRYLKSINICMRDFLTPEKCRDIIDLNIAKGLIAQK